MKNIIEQVRQMKAETLSYEQLGDFVRGIDVASLDFEQLVPPLNRPDDYSRNILLMEPLEVVLLHWPPGVESAVHLHEGFWGYVLCLQGQIDNVEYKLDGTVMSDIRSIRALPGGVVAEPDGTIHKIVNPSKTETLVTLHFYHPALESLDGLVMYDLETGDIGTLNEKADCASFKEPRGHFRDYREAAFTYRAYSDLKGARTHRIHPIIPKPDGEEIKEMVGDYYEEQALVYDMFDLRDDSRRKYTRRINELISIEISNKPRLERYLALACGTGRRAIRIRELSGRSYDLSGVDISESMCSVARKRGLNVLANDWLSAEVPDNHYDVATFLYAFGHIPSANERRAALEKIYHKLRPEGYLFMDLFNAEDENEWGPSAIQSFQRMELGKYGYDKGDVFYKKTDGDAIAFLHYFYADDLRELLESIGFELEFIRQVGYVHRSGELLDENDTGSLFVKAVKP